MVSTKKQITMLVCNQNKIEVSSILYVSIASFAK